MDNFLKNMKIVEENVAKAEKIFKALGYTAEQTEDAKTKISQLLQLEIAAEAMAEKGSELGDVNFTQDEVGDFLEDNYSEAELVIISKRVVRDFFVEYFTKVLKAKESSEEDVEKVESIIGVTFK